MTENLTLQDVLDKAYTAIKEQGAFGYDETTESCAYLTRDNHTCMVGALLVDDDMRRRWDALDYTIPALLITTDLPEQFLQDRKAAGLDDIPLEFLKDLQAIHDRNAMYDEWEALKGDIREFAEDHDLVSPA